MIIGTKSLSSDQAPRNETLNFNWFKRKSRLYFNMTFSLTQYSNFVYNLNERLLTKSLSSNDTGFGR
jgi:hypothetical protein